MALALQSERLTRAGFRHAFFTRRGLDFAVARHRGDTPHPGRAEASLTLAASALGLEPERLYWPSQVHGSDVVLLCGDEPRERVARQQGDAALTATAGVGCGVRTADCAAVLIADRASGAVAAVHCGWRGTVRGVVGAGVEALRRLGATELIAAVGPHIEACCFEVGPEVAVELAAASPLGAAAVRPGRRERPHVDLRAVIAAQLEAAGVRAVDHVRGCTVCDAERFHSHRRDGPRSGRMLAAIVGRDNLRKRG